MELIVHRLPKTPMTVYNQRRNMFTGWLNAIFNKVDEDRIRRVGADRACAEWLLRCGAGVRWVQMGSADDLLRDYNSLPPENQARNLHIQEIDATDSAVMNIGFPYFRGLRHCEKAVFHRCNYMEDSCVEALGNLKQCLQHLQLSSNGNITDAGILTLTQMGKLRRLHMFDLLEVKDRQNCINVLQTSLPNCQITFPWAQENEIPKKEK